MIDIAFIFFRTLRLEHLDAAWFALSQQDFTLVNRIVLLDNNTAYTPLEIQTVIARYPVPVPVFFSFEKHGDHTKTQSWSCNMAARLTSAEWLFLTRADFLLDATALARFREVVVSRSQGWRGFVTSWCHQMGYDAQLSNTDALAPHSLPDASWRTEGLASLVGTVPACHFTNTHLDAGVWLIRRSLVAEVGGLNERMVSWGYQQQAFQRALVAAGVEIVNIPEFLFHHQHHAAPRDFAQAGAEAIWEHQR